MAQKQLSQPPPNQPRRQTGHYASYAKKGRQSCWQVHPRIYSSDIWEGSMSLNCYPTLFCRLDESSGVEEVLRANNSWYHNTCGLKYYKTMLDWDKNRDLKIGAVEEVVAYKWTRYLSWPSSTKIKPQKVKCFIREAPACASLHEATSFIPALYVRL